MTSEGRAPLRTEVQEMFDWVIEHLYQGIPTDAGFDAKTYRALVEASLDPMNEDLKSIARNEFRKQLSGVHEKEDDDEWDTAIRAVSG